MASLPRATLLLSLCCGSILAACDAREYGPEYGQDYLVTAVEHRIGDQAEGQTPFGWIANVAVSRDGKRIYVIDRLNAEITIWTPEGTLLNTVGRRGDGPGDFRDPGAVVPLDDGFQVMDGSRFTSFSSAGEVTGVHQLPAATSYRGFRLVPMGRTRQGEIVAFPQTPASVTAGWHGDDPTWEYPLLIVTETDSGWDVRTLLQVDDRNGGLSIRPYEGDVGGYHSVQPYGDSDLTVFDPETGSVVIARRRGLAPGQVYLTEVSIDGDTVWTRNVQFPPVRIEPAAVRRFLDAESREVAATWPDVSLDRARRSLQEALFVPEHYPAVDVISATGNGEVWLRTAGNEETDTVRVWYPVMRGSDQDDTLSGVLLPDYFFPLAYRGHLLWGVAYDALDVNFVEAREIIPAS